MALERGTIGHRWARTQPAPVTIRKHASLQDPLPPPTRTRYLFSQYRCLVSPNHLPVPTKTDSSVDKETVSWSKLKESSNQLRRRSSLHPDEYYVMHTFVIKPWGNSVNCTIQLSVLQRGPATKRRRNKCIALSIRHRGAWTTVYWSEPRCNVLTVEFPFGSEDNLQELFHIAWRLSVQRLKNKRT